ncbi:MAG: hypothetical protein WC749_17240 [Dehalococcoidia bacterium]
MWKHKKIILVTLLVVVIAASTAVVAFAQTASDDQSQTPESREADLLTKVAAIYETNTGTAIDVSALTTAFDQAQKEMATEAMNTRLQNLVTDGKLTQEQADQYKTWLQARPDTPLTGPLGNGLGGGMGWGRGGQGGGPCR